MKNYLKVFGVMALVAVIGFSMIACDDGSGGGGGGGGALSGTYSYEDYTITFSGSSFTYDMGEWGTIKGTYTVSDSTLTLTVTAVTGLVAEFANVGDKETWTIVNNNTLRDGDGDEWIKPGSSNNGGGGDANTLSGTYISGNGNITISFSGNTFVMNSDTGTYTINGSTITFIFTDYPDNPLTGTLSADKNTITVESLVATFTKQSGSDNGTASNLWPESYLGDWIRLDSSNNYITLYSSGRSYIQFSGMSSGLTVQSIGDGTIDVYQSVSGGNRYYTLGFVVRDGVLRLSSNEDVFADYVNKDYYIASAYAVLLAGDWYDASDSLAFTISADGTSYTNASGTSYLFQVSRASLGYKTDTASYWTAFINYYSLSGNTLTGTFYGSTVTYTRK